MEWIPLAWGVHELKSRPNTKVPARFVLKHLKILLLIPPRASEKVFVLVKLENLVESILIVTVVESFDTTVGATHVPAPPGGISPGSSICVIPLMPHNRTLSP